MQRLTLWLLISFPFIVFCSKKAPDDVVLLKSLLNSLEQAIVVQNTAKIDSLSASSDSLSSIIFQRLEISSAVTKASFTQKKIEIHNHRSQINSLLVLEEKDNKKMVKEEITVRLDLEKINKEWKITDFKASRM